MSPPGVKGTCIAESLWQGQTQAYNYLRRLRNAFAGGESEYDLLDADAGDYDQGSLLVSVCLNDTYVAVVFDSDKARVIASAGSVDDGHLDYADPHLFEKVEKSFAAYGIPFRWSPEAASA